MTKKKLNSIISGIFAAAIIIFSAIFLSAAKNTDTAATRVFLADMFAVLLFADIAIFYYFRASLRDSLYSYRNVILVGAMIYFDLQLIVLIFYFISSVFHRENLTARGIFQFLTRFPREFSYFAVPVFLIICALICVRNISLIRHEGFRPKNLLGFLLGFFYIGATVALYIASDFLEKRIPDTDAGTLLNTFIPLCFLLILCYLECIFAGFAIMSAISFRHIPAYDKDFIIILGCSISRAGGLLPLLKGRTNRAIRFAWDQEIATGKKVLYVPSGGQGNDEIMSEGSAMELYLLAHGAETDEVYPEKKSADTSENFRFSKKIIDGLKPDARVAFATTNYHVYRSGILARYAGLDCEGIASKTKWYFWPNGFVREFFAFLSMHRKEHITVSALCAAVCAVLALTAYFCNLI